ncbi:S8 family peptidase [Bdellovibrio sp. HCB337]|uniref:S8 family peptidase n=1 Tax=Bdellovibrio sp. HCB337 TaxID=3394358 RepID=UPI0039A52228
MRSSHKLSIFIGGVFVAFIGTFGTYQYLQGEGPHRGSDSVKKSNRLEESKITSKTEIVENEPSALFNDPAINQAWGLKKSDAARAWSVSKGSRSVVVAVIDTGADVSHEDMDENIWSNPGETGKDSKGRDKATNKVDDDGNGFVDDVHGWNFVSNNNSLTDNHGHGTHIAGIIGAKAGNNKGISGISPEVSLMILKYYDPKVSGTDNLKNTVASIKYAVKMGANIINYSGGGTEFSQEEKDAIVEAEKKGILFVAAAGNERSNSDQFKYYPADYGLSNIVSVTAIDPSTEVLSSSNYGVETVDLAAPGQNILSCLPGNTYGYMTGTSQATAFVSGAAALVMARREAFKAVEIKKYILSTGDAVASLSTKTRTSRQLNLYKALTILDQGLGLTGVAASNRSGASNQDFSVDPNVAKKDSTSEMTTFGRSLLKNMEKMGRIGDKQNANPPQ